MWVKTYVGQVKPSAGEKSRLAYTSISIIEVQSVTVSRSHRLCERWPYGGRSLHFSGMVRGGNGDGDGALLRY